MTERLVVIGGDAAGMSAASQARRRRGPEQLRIVAFESGGFSSYSACGIPYWVGGLVADPVGDAAGGADRSSCGSSPSRAAASAPTRPAASPTGSAGWSPSVTR
jgi:hypothetical protein